MAPAVARLHSLGRNQIAGYPPIGSCPLWVESGTSGAGEAAHVRFRLDSLVRL